MGRSVNYHSDAHQKIYLHYEVDDDDSVDYFIAQENWQFFIDYLMEVMQEFAPSLDTCKEEWHDREVKKIAENGVCSVWISEYCGLVSLSFVPDQNNLQGLAENWIDQVVPQIRKKFIQNKSQVLTKLGSFSNGEGVFELAKS